MHFLLQSVRVHQMNASMERGTLLPANVTVKKLGMDINVRVGILISY